MRAIKKDPGKGKKVLQSIPINRGAIRKHEKTQ